MSKVIKTSSSSAWPFPYCVAATAVCISLSLMRPTLEAHKRHPNRQYADFAAFWPLYVSQHSLPATKLLHVVGTSIGIISVVVAHGLNKFQRLGLGVATGVALALCCVDLTAHFATGLHEALVFGVLLIACTRAYSGLTIGSILKPVLIGYAFAWVGHFFIEHNRPATFLHPTFSFLGDMKLLWQIATNQLALDATTA